MSFLLHATYRKMAKVTRQQHNLENGGTGPELISLLEKQRRREPALSDDGSDESSV
jgi:hypothetical protein